MGVRKRWIWLGILLLFCMMFSGCGEKEQELAEEPTVTAKIPTVITTAASAVPSTAPSIEPVRATPTEQPTEKPTEQPTEKPTEQPTERPIEQPTEKSTAEPVAVPPVDVSIAATEAVSPVPMIETPSPVRQETSFVEHTHVLTVESQEAACLTAGWTKEYCKDCGELICEKEGAAALGHDFVKSVWELPTCQKGGYYNNICNRCGLVECVNQNALPHEVEDIVVQDGNCMEDTIIRHICKQCGTQVKSDTRYTVYDVHSWLTETIEGVEISYCEWCGVSK